MTCTSGSVAAPAEGGVVCDEGLVGGACGVVDGVAAGGLVAGGVVPGVASDCCAIASGVPPNIAINATTAADKVSRPFITPTSPNFRGRMLASSRRCNINFFSVCDSHPITQENVL
jgi:hypothetical protein